MVSRERKMKYPGVQRVPQLPNGPGTGGPTENPSSPRTLVVEKCQHVLARKKREEKEQKSDEYQVKREGMQ